MSQHAITEDLSATNIAGTSVTIGWTVANRRISHEYVVYYGTSVDSLDETSSTVDSISSSPGTDESYDVSLTGLTPDTIYYYQVEATLEGFSFESEIDTFTTLEQGMHKICSRYIYFNHICNRFQPLLLPQ